MRAITLTQPWAQLVVTGRKRVETRSWPTSIRERVAVHAAKGMPGWAIDAANEFGLAVRLMPRGAVIGTVRIINCVPTDALPDLSDEERSYGDFSAGRFAWILEDPLPIRPPVDARGALGFWKWSAS